MTDKPRTRPLPRLWSKNRVCRLPARQFRAFYDPNLHMASGKRVAPKASMRQLAEQTRDCMQAQRRIQEYTCPLKKTQKHISS